MANPYDDFWSSPDDDKKPAPAARRTIQAPRRAPTGPARPHQTARAAQAKAAGWSFGSILKSVDDNVRLLANGLTYGYADKWAARANSTFTGRTVKAQQAEERRHTGEARKEQGFDVPYIGEVAPAEIIGGILSPASKLGYGVKTIKGMAAVGAADAFISGMGYSDEDSWSGTIEDGVRMAPWGVLGGVVVGSAIKAAPKAVKLIRKTKPKEIEAAPAVKPKDAQAEPVAKPTEVSVTDDGAGYADDLARKLDPEDGALTTPQALKDAPEEAITTAKAKIALMSDEQAEAWAKRVEENETSGELLEDPHYRSILDVDISDVATAPQKLIAAVNAAEEIHEAVLDRVATRAVSTKEADAGARKVLDGMGDDELNSMVQRADQGIRDARVATVLMARAGVEAVRSLEGYSKALAENAADALPAFKENLSRTLYVYAHGAAVRSKQGRALQIGQETNGLMKAADDLWDLDEVQITGKIEETFNALGPDEVKRLMSRLKSGEDLEDVFDVLMNPARAKAVSYFSRATGTFEAFLKSNALTPVTAVVNGVGSILHDSFRNGLGRRWAAARLARNGQEMEALGIRLELEAANAVYYRAHMLGLKSMLDRIKFDLWEGVESVSSVGFGSGKIAAKATASRQALAAKGTFSTKIRENTSTDPKGRLRINDTEAFNQRMDELTASGSFGQLWAGAQRAGAMGLNALDFGGTLSGKLFTGALDVWGQNFVIFKEKYALAARSAVKEAMEKGLDPEDIPDFVRKRTVAKAEVPDEEMWHKTEEAILRGTDQDPEVRDWLARKAAAEQESLRVTFMDGPQTQFGKKSADFLGLDKVGIIMPYIRTPIRLLERGLVDYTPLGRFAKEGRQIIAAGGPEAAMYKAQMEIGATVSMIGLGLGASGLAVVTNGAWESSKNLEGEPTNRLQIGNFHAEFGRLDPFSTTLAIGAMFGQAAKDGFTDYEQYRDFEQAKQAALSTLAFGFKDAVLSKSYLKGLKDAIDMFFDGSANKVEKLEASVASRMIPMGGTQKLINDTARPSQPEVVSVADGLYRSILGLGLGLPAKRNALGDEIEGRDLGVSVGLSNDTLDEVGLRLKELGINLADVKKTDPKGFRRTAAQLDRLRQIRGHEALDNEGRTMREALLDTLNSEEFELMGSKGAREEMIAETIRDFNKPAIAILEEEDGSYQASRSAHVTFEEYLKMGDSLSEAAEKAEADTTEEFGEDFTF